VDCAEFEHLVDAYLNGELNGSFKLEFESHIVECKTCAHLVAMMEAVGGIIADPGYDEPKLRDDFTDRVVADFARVQVRRRRWYSVASGAAAAALIILVFASLIRFAWPQADAPDAPGTELALVSPEGSGDIIRPADRSVGSLTGERTAEQETAIDRILAEVLDPSPAYAPGHVDDQAPTAIPEALGANNISNDQTPMHVKPEFQDWFAGTLRQAEDTMVHLQQLRGYAVDRMRNALLDTISGRQIRVNSPLPGSVDRDDAVGSEPVPPVEPSSVNSDFELII